MSDECCGTGAARDEEPVAPWAQRSIQASAASGVFLLAGLLADGTTSTVLYVVALLLGGWTFVPETLEGLRRGRLGVGVLMTIAGIGAIALGELGEAASLAFLFSVSEALEGWALARSRRSLRALLDLVPDTATVQRGGDEVEVPVSELRIGDRLVLRAGERLGTDGVVVEGSSTIDQSAVTGESLPVEAVPGRALFAASINGTSPLIVEVTAVADESSLARVVHIVEEAQERKGTGQRMAERIARPMVPGVLILAAAIAAIGSLLGDPSLWVHRALVVLVAAAPCAFAISVPVAVMAAIGAASRGGVLVKGGAALEALARVQIVALDKTGTLTKNAPQVIAVIPAESATVREVLRIAGALEQRSEHPLAAAIVAAAGEGPVADDVEVVPGHGIEGSVDGTRARLGKPAFVDPGVLADRVDRLQDEGATVVVVEHDGRPIGLIAVRDELREESPRVVQRLRTMGMRRIVMLTGDNRRTAEALGALAGVDDVGADLLPEDKLQRIGALQQDGPTAMVGDGINDAPALATADVGIAMGAAGSDVAIEAADVALMGERLDNLVAIFGHAQRSTSIMRQNLAMSGCILVVLIPLAATGVLGLAQVVLTHEMAEVLVIANGVRASRMKRAVDASTPELTPTRTPEPAAR